MLYNYNITVHNHNTNDKPSFYISTSAILQYRYVRQASSLAGQLVKSLAKKRKEQSKALEQLQETREGREKLFLRPDSTLVCVWGGLVLLSMVYNCVALPVRVAFLEGEGYSPLLNTLFLSVDVIIDAMYLVDIALRAYVIGFFNRNDVVMQRKRIFANYVREQAPFNLFFLHLMAAVPADMVLLAVVSSNSTTASTPLIGFLGLHQSVALLRLNRLLRIVDLNKLWSQCVEESFVTAVQVRRLCSTYTRWLGWGNHTSIDYGMISPLTRF